MPDTVVDFWRMLWETDSCIVVMLTGKPERNPYDSHPGQPGRYAEYWPLDGPLRYGQFLVELQSEFQFDNYILHEFKITHVNVGGGIKETVSEMFIFRPTKLGQFDISNFSTGQIEEARLSKILMASYKRLTAPKSNSVWKAPYASIVRMGLEEQECLLP